MDVVKIVQLSDLHFSENKDINVWDEVARYINKEIKPHAILITGDITDDATELEFALAARSLAQLETRRHEPGKPSFFIVPGNHDRYDVYGNKVFGGILNRNSKKMRFEATFKDGQILTPLGCADLTLEEARNKWKVRVIGLDSNIAGLFAQGAIDETSAMEAARSALARSAVESDVVIAMVHHHVMPIPAIERRAIQTGGIQLVANFTGMLNAGVLMHHLSRAQVNLILHGHEHIAHQAIFRDASPDGGPSVVLAAGSGTGEKTGERWALERVHFNVLELSSERSVSLRQVEFDGTSLKLGESLRLLTGEDIRRARFIRRWRRGLADKKLEQKKYDSPLKLSRLKTRVNIGLDRNADYVETTTNYLVDDEWALVTRSPSGCVDFANVTFDWRDGDLTEFNTPFVASANSEPESFVCGIRQDRRVHPLVNRITARWRWTGAIALTRHELDALPRYARLWLRSQGREFLSISIHPQDEFESATLTIQLPEDYAPADDEFRVHVVDEGVREELQLSEELTGLLEHCGRGHVELRIPYPLPNHRYFVSWVPVDRVDSVIAYSDAFAEQIAAAAQKLVVRASSAIRGGLSKTDVRIGLYQIAALQHKLLTLAKGDNGCPVQLKISDARSRGRAALWGSIGVVERERDHGSDLLPDERMLLLLPVRPQWANGGRGAGLLRVAVLSTGVLNWAVEGEIPVEVTELAERATLAVIDMVRSVSGL